MFNKEKYSEIKKQLDYHKAREDFLLNENKQLRNRISDMCEEKKQMGFDAYTYKKIKDVFEKMVERDNRILDEAVLLMMISNGETSFDIFPEQADVLLKIVERYDLALDKKQSKFEEDFCHIEIEKSKIRIAKDDFTRLCGTVMGYDNEFFVIKKQGSKFDICTEQGIPYHETLEKPKESVVPNYVDFDYVDFEDDDFENDNQTPQKKQQDTALEK